MAISRLIQGYARATLLDWKLSEATQPISDGTFLFVVTIRDLQGKFRQRLGNVAVEAGPGNPEDATSRCNQSTTKAGMGTSDKAIGIQDLTGVSLAAIKALDERTLQLQQKQNEVEQLRLQVAQLESANRRWNDASRLWKTPRRSHNNALAVLLDVN